MTTTTTPQVKLAKQKMAFYNGKKAKPDVLAQSLRTLASILKVGESEARALEITGHEFKKYDVGRSYTRAAKVMREQGASFKQAILAEDVFPRTVRELVGAAATSAGIHSNLRQAAKLVSQSQNVKKKLIVSMIQPSFMFGLALVLLFVASAVILPGYVGMFATIGSKTPAMTLIVLQVADVTKWVLGILIGVVLLFVAFWYVYGRRSQKMVVLIDSIGIRLPVLGPILSLSATSRLFELLATNLETGMGEAAALESAGAGCGSEALRAHTARHAKAMRERGERLGEFARTNLMPSTAKHMVSTAPSVKQQIDVMKDLGPEYRADADIRLEQFTKTIEPLVNYFVYAVAAVLIIAIVVPMYGIFPDLMKLSDTSGSADPTGGLMKP